MELMVSKKQLRDNLMAILNRTTKHRYGLLSEYGKYRLCRLLNDKDTKDGISNMSPYCTHREIESVLSTLINVLLEEHKL